MEQDVLEVLVEDHAVLRWLADRVQNAPAGRARATLFNEFARALAAHQTVVDQTILPALKGFGWSGVRSDLLAGHMALKRRLAEAVALERQAPAFHGVADGLARQAKDQCGLERDALLPVLRARLDDAQRSSLALDAEQHLTRLLGEKPKVHQDADLGPDAVDLVEEAYVVLGSLPAQTGVPTTGR